MTMPETDRRAKPSFLVVWTSRFAPALAASLGSYIMTQLSLRGMNFQFLGVGSEEMKGAFVFALTILFVEPMIYINILCAIIEAIRQFVCTASQKLSTAMKCPIQPDKGDTP